MDHSALVEGIKKHLEQGDPVAQIKQEVLQAGYSEVEFNQAFADASMQMSTASAVQQPPVTTTPAASDPVATGTQPAVPTSVGLSTTAPDQPDPHSQPSPTTGFSVLGVVRESFSFLLQRIDVVAITLGVQLLTGLLVFVAMILWVGPGSLLLFTVFGLGFLVLLVVNALSIGAVLYVVAENSGPRSYYDGFMLAARNWWPLLLLYLGLAFVTMGGFVLLIIPGIFLSVALALAFMVYVREGRRGVVALDRSWQIVRGQWWRVFAVFLILGIVSGISQIPLLLYPESFLAELPTIIVETICLVATIKAMALLYDHLAPQKPEYVPRRVIWLHVLFWVGLILPFVLLFGLTYILASMSVAMEKGDDAALQQTVSYMRPMVEIYGNQVDGTVDYSGFCTSEELFAYSEESANAGAVSCDSTESSYIFEAELSDGTFICADSTGFMDIVSSSQLGAGNCGGGIVVDEFANPETPVGIAATQEQNADCQLLHSERVESVAAEYKQDADEVVPSVFFSPSLDHCVGIIDFFVDGNFSSYLIFDATTGSDLDQPAATAALADWNASALQ